MEDVEELLEFLKSNRPDVRKQASKDVLDLTGTDRGIVLLNSAERHDVIALLCRLLGDQDDVSLNAAKALVNMSCNERAKTSLLERATFWSSVLETIAQLGPELKHTKKNVPEKFLVCIKLLNNATTSIFGAERLMQGRLGDEFRGFDVKMLLGLLFTRPIELAEISLIITNVTQLDDGRDLVLDEEEPYIGHILKMIDFNNEIIRKSAIETIKNCCLSNPDVQLKLLASMGLTERLLKLLLGPEGIEDEDDFEELPRYLKECIQLSKKQFNETGIEKEREPNAEIRRLVIDILLLVAQQRECREVLRGKKAYTVIKAYHPTEENEETSDLVFDLVDLLLGEEEEHTVKLPEIVEIEHVVSFSNGNTGTSDENKSILYDLD